MKKINKFRIRSAVRNTLEKYRVRSVTADSIRRIIRARGFTLMRLTEEGNADSDKLLTSLGFSDADVCDGALTVDDGENKIVFLADDVPEERQLYLLSRELGAMLLTKPKDGRLTVSEEDRAAAKAFADQIVRIPRRSTLGNTAVYHPAATAIIAALLMATVVLVVMLFAMPEAIPQSATLPAADAAPAADRSLRAEPQPSAAGKKTDEPLRISSEITQPERLTEESGFAPITDTDALPGYDETVGNNAGFITLTPSEPITPAAERTMPVSTGEPAETAPQAAVPSGYFATGSGKKYHVAACGYLTGKTVHEVSQQEIASGKYTPCSKCIK